MPFAAAGPLVPSTGPLTPRMYHKRPSALKKKRLPSMTSLLIIVRVMPGAASLQAAHSGRLAHRLNRFIEYHGISSPCGTGCTVCGTAVTVGPAGVGVGGLSMIVTVGAGTGVEVEDGATVLA